MQVTKGNRTNSSTAKIAILGGGNAGRGLAGYMSLHGLDVALYNRTLENVRGIIDHTDCDCTCPGTWVLCAQDGALSR
jgi:glycerol-3-phosphate dehydrogenase